MMEKLVKIFTLLALVLCYKMNAQENKFEDYEIYVNEIVRTFAKEMKKDFNLICTGDGGRMPKDVEEIEVMFIIYKKATIDEARELEVKATERLLKIINEHEKIRPFLREHPFKTDRAQVSISFRKKDNTRYNDGSVAYMSQAKNKIFYCSEDPVTNTLLDLCDESFDDAVKIVQSSSQNKKNNSNQSF